MKKLFAFVIGAFAAVSLMCCGGLLLVGLVSKPLTPEQQAQRDREMAERRDKQAVLDEQRKADRERAASDAAVKQEEDAAARREQDREAAIRSARNEEKWNAIDAGKTFVKRKLAHPSTASFPWAAPDATKLADGTWLIKGTVKAKNTFNLEVTLHFSCRVKRNAANKTWELIDCMVNESGD